MDRSRFPTLLGLSLLLVLFSCHLLVAQKASVPNPPPDYKLLTAMSLCGDVECLNAYRQQAGSTKLGRIVYYEKWILLEPSKTAAEGLLHNIPVSEAEQSQMMTLPDWHQDATKSTKDMESLAQIYEHWPHSLANAVMMFPQYLPAYIRYGLLAPNDVHSDYTGNEERVCRNDPAQFQAAFERLDGKTQAHLRKHVFNPEKCRAIFITEAD
jgi:hypothetical protein